MTTNRRSVPALLLAGITITLPVWSQAQLELSAGPGSGPPPKKVVVYKSRGSSGEISYSSVPSKGAESLDVVVAPSIPRIKITPVGSVDSAPEKSLTGLTIVSPANGSLVRTNNGDVAVTLKVEPGLLAGNTLVAEIDGVRRELDSPAFAIENLSRGVHELRVVLVGPHGAPVSTERVSTFQVTRVSDATPRPQVAAPQAPKPSYPTGAALPPPPPRPPIPAGAARSP